jgi:hypothetical protein
MTFILLIIFWIFLIWDCVFFARYHEKFETPGWKCWLFAVLPGSGFYYKSLADKKEKS